jgi:hypothetical protein
VAVANAGFGGVSFALGKGQGSLGIPRTVVVAGTWAMVVKDLNGDGKPDLAISDVIHSKVAVLLNASP